MKLSAALEKREFQVCISVKFPNRLIRARLETSAIDHLSNETDRFICKPIWDDGGFGLGINRYEAGPWQTRLKLSNQKMMV